MACTSLTALPRACGAAGVVAGVEKLYMIAYVDLAPASGVAGSPYYTLASNGMVSDIGLDTGKKYVEIGILKSTVGAKENGTFNAQNGTAFFTQEFPITLSDLTVENKAFVENILNQPVSILFKSRTGKYFVIGLNGQLQLSALEGGSGVAEGDLIGYTLTFTGISTTLIPMVEDALIADIVA